VGLTKLRCEVKPDAAPDGNTRLNIPTENRTEQEAGSLASFQQLRIRDGRTFSSYCFLLISPVQRSKLTDLMTIVTRCIHV
jgi:hypothetical protein